FCIGLVWGHTLQFYTSSSNDWDARFGYQQELECKYSTYPVCVTSEMRRPQESSCVVVPSSAG
ncbi:hypothetical protein KI387_028931, partial [Taxus chinensis]